MFLADYELTHNRIIYGNVSEYVLTNPLKIWWEFNQSETEWHRVDK